MWVIFSVLLAFAGALAAAAAAQPGVNGTTINLPEISPFKKKYQQRFNGTASVLVVFYHPDLPVSVKRQIRSHV